MTNQWKYLVTTPYDEPFFTDWFDIENHYIDGMVVYDLINQEYYDGKHTLEIIEDSL